MVLNLIVKAIYACASLIFEYIYIICKYIYIYHIFKHIYIYDYIRVCSCFKLNGIVPPTP